MKHIVQTITALTTQRRNKERVSVYLDGEFAFGLAWITAANLQVGQTLTAEEIADLQGDDTLEKAKQGALRFISYRPRSIAEVRRNLKGKGYEEATIEQVISRLTELELLDDQAFAQYWVEQRESFKPRSQLALRQELFQKGIARRIIDEVVVGVDEVEAARQSGQKKARALAGLSEEEFLQRLGGYLQRRGFSYAIVEAVTQELWDAMAAG
jgi:regulatory protein